MIDADQAHCDQLTKDIAPVGITQLSADAEYTQALMIPALHALIVLAAQYFDHMHGAETLAGPVNRRQCLLCRIGRIPGSGRRKAGIAISTGRARLAEIGKQADAAALRGFAQSQQRIQLAA